MSPEITKILTDYGPVINIVLGVVAFFIFLWMLPALVSIYTAIYLFLTKASKPILTLFVGMLLLGIIGFCFYSATKSKPATTAATVQTEAKVSASSDTPKLEVTQPVACLQKLASDDKLRSDTQFMKICKVECLNYVSTQSKLDFKTVCKEFYK